MTTEVARQAATNSGGSTGTVFDIGYRNYTGTREGRGRSRTAVIMT